MSGLILESDSRQDQTLINLSLQISEPDLILCSMPIMQKNIDAKGISATLELYYLNGTMRCRPTITGNLFKNSSCIERLWKIRLFFAPLYTKIGFVVQHTILCVLS